MVLYNIYWLFYARCYTEGFYVLIMIIIITTINLMFSVYHTHLAESVGTRSESPSSPVLVLIHTCTSTTLYEVLSNYFCAAWGSDSRVFPYTAAFGIFPFVPSSYFCWLWQQTMKTPFMLLPQIEVHEADKGADTTHSCTRKAVKPPCAAFLYVF